MTKAELRKRLDDVDASREKRSQITKQVVDNPDLVRPLLKICFAVDDSISVKACWILEFTLKKNLTYLYPHLDFFCKNIYKVHLDSAVRPLAKICELLVTSYFHRADTEAKRIMTEEHLEKITSASFDWLIGKHKVAAKAYSMTSLYLLGTKYEWIHPELKLVLEQNYKDGSAGYKARARLLLKKLK